jgi:hypothetical protein
MYLREPLRFATGQSGSTNGSPREVAVVAGRGMSVVQGTLGPRRDPLLRRVPVRLLPLPEGGWRYGTEAAPLRVRTTSSFHPSAALELSDEIVARSMLPTCAAAARAAASSLTILEDVPQVDSQMTASVQVAMRPLSHLAQAALEVMRASAWLR